MRARLASTLAFAGGTVALAMGAASCGYPSFDFDAQPATDATTADVTDLADAATSDDGVETNDAGFSGDSTTIDGGATSDATDAGEVGLPDPSCPGSSDGLNACASIPAYPSGVVPVIDGDGSELCGLRAATLSYASSDWANPDPVAKFAQGLTAHLRLAWYAGTGADDSGIHLHMFVNDAAAIPAPDGKATLEGAALEVYFAGYYQTTGKWGGSDDPGAISLAFPAPGRAAPEHVGWLVAGKETMEAPASILFASRSVVGGYEIEARIPWSQMFSTADSYPTPRTNAQIAFNFALYARDASGTLAEVMYYLNTTITALSCSATAPADCDDRTWCIPRLASP